MRRAQILVELAVTLPFLMLLILGAAELGFLIVDKGHQDRSTSTVAAYAAGRADDSWHSVAARELPGCDVTLSTPQPGLLEVKATCQYRPRVIPGWSGLPISSSESAVVSPESTPGASPSSSSTASPAEPSASGSLP